MAIHVLKVGMLLKITFTTRILSLSSPKTGSRVAEIKFASSSSSSSSSSSFFLLPVMHFDK